MGDEKEEYLELQFNTEDAANENLVQLYQNEAYEEEKEQSAVVENAQVDLLKIQVKGDDSRITYEKLQRDIDSLSKKLDACKAQMDQDRARFENNMRKRASALTSIDKNKEPRVVTGFEVATNAVTTPNTATTTVTDDELSSSKENKVDNEENRTNNIPTDALSSCKPTPAAVVFCPPPSPPLNNSHVSCEDIFSHLPVVGSSLASSFMSYTDPERVSLPSQVGIFILPQGPIVVNKKPDDTAVTAAATTACLSEVEYNARWNEFCQVNDCPTVDLVQEMDNSWFGTAPGSRPKTTFWGGERRSYSVEGQNVDITPPPITDISTNNAVQTDDVSLTAPNTSTTTATATPKTKKRGFMSKFGSWMTKVTSNKLGFLNEALL
jgi:hypothetical protein